MLLAGCLLLSSMLPAAIIALRPNCFHMFLQSPPCPPCALKSTFAILSVQRCLLQPAFPRVAHAKVLRLTIARDTKASVGISKVLGKWSLSRGNGSSGSHQRGPKRLHKISTGTAPENTWNCITQSASKWFKMQTQQNSSQSISEKTQRAQPPEATPEIQKKHTSDPKKVRTIAPRT